MNELAIKDVEFNGAILKAIQDELGKIFVGVRWVCNGLGLTRGQINNENDRIQKDLVLKQGCTKFRAGVFDENNETWALDIEFLPLWLAKISITPKMKNENPELVEKLITYQLKAKEVLAKAFLNKEDTLPQVQQAIQPNIQLVLPNMDIHFQEMNIKIDRLYEDMSKFVKFMMDWKQHSEGVHQIVDNTIETYSSIIGNISSAGTIINDCQKWKKNKYDLIDDLLKVDTKFSDRKQVLNYIYRHMNKNYGIVWAQEVLDYKENYNLDYKPSTIDIVYNNDTYRSIFDSVLIDLIGNADTISVSSSEMSLDDIIAPLVEKYDDHSPYSAVTYKKIYKVMEDNYRVSWKNHIARCKKAGIDKPKRKDMIIAKPQLRKKFELSVKELLTV